MRCYLVFGSEQHGAGAVIEVGTYEAKTRLPELLKRVEAGETVVITRRGKLIARITSTGQDRAAEIAATVGRIEDFRNTMPRMTAEEILSARDEGRRY